VDDEDDSAADEAVGVDADEPGTSTDTLAEEVFDRQTVEIFLDGVECGPSDVCAPRDATMLGVVYRAGDLVPADRLDAMFGIVRGVEVEGIELWSLTGEDVLDTFAVTEQNSMPFFYEPIADS